MGRKRDPKPVQVVVTRYELADGTRCAKGDPGARKVRTKSESYYYRKPGKRGEPRPYVPLGTTNLMEAMEAMRKLLRAESDEAAGIRSPLAGHAERPLADHLSEWLASVQQGRASPKRLALLRSRLEELARLAGWRRISDLSRATCVRALAALESAPGTGTASRGRSVQTRNHYLGHARQLARWLLAEGRLARDPFAGLEPVAVAGHERHRRRVPDAEEVRLLFAHLGSDAAAVRCGMSGAVRSLAYAVAMTTGLRGDEVRTLARANFSADCLTVALGAKADKSRSAARSRSRPGWPNGCGPGWRRAAACSRRSRQATPAAC